MKIVLLSLFDNSSSGGGESRIVFELAENLMKNNVEVVIVCPGKRTEEIIDENNIKKFTIKSLGHPLSPFSNLTSPNVKKLFAYLDKFSPNVLHSHTVSVIGLLGQIWSIKNNVPFVYTAHETPTKMNEFIRASGLIKNVIGDNIIKLLINDFLDNCSAVVALTNSVKKNVLSTTYKNKVYIIPNARDLNNYNKIKIAKLNSPKTNLLYIGYICERKNQKYLIEVLKNLPDSFELTLIGEAIEKDYYKDIMLMINQYHLNNRVIFTGPIEHSHLQPYLEKAHIFIRASKFEAFSLVTLEAIASAKLVVMLYEQSDVEWVPQPEVTIMDKDTLPLTFAEKIIELSKMSQKQYDQIVSMAREKTAKYNWEEIIKQHLDMYIELIHNYKLGHNPKIFITRLTKYINYLKDPFLKNYLTKLIFHRNKSINPTVNKNVGIKKKIILSSAVGVSIAGYIFFKLVNNMKTKKTKNLKAKD